MWKRLTFPLNHLLGSKFDESIKKPKAPGLAVTEFLVSWQRLQRLNDKGTMAERRRVVSTCSTRVICYFLTCITLHPSAWDEQGSPRGAEDRVAPGNPPIDPGNLPSSCGDGGVTHTWLCSVLTSGSALRYYS